jgi:cobalt-zinc-cadmium efflux system protein
VKRHPLNFVFILTLGYFFVELAGGIYYNSLALLTDAAFMALNVTGQFMALYAISLSKKPANKRYTFGHERAKVISALANGILTGFILFYVFIEAYGKIRHPEPVVADRVLIIAAAGLVVNGIGLIKLRKDTQDINIRGAYLRVLTDALGSVGVVFSSIIIHFTGLYVADPIAGIAIGLLVAYPAYALVGQSLHILMEGNPTGISPKKVKKFIKRHHPFVLRVRDLHLWGLSPSKAILLARIRTDGSPCGREEIRTMKAALTAQFGLYDIYLEVYEDEAETDIASNVQKVSEQQTARESSCQN